uniref:Uncharacterized protein n=1 Tax=Neisseria meningitidis alpha522 TaxID=996307 RepID=I4E723_NEIME|nr:hypothetical protein NMALPHA522_1600 [Neisseria meningitidis alpha522]
MAVLTNFCCVNHSFWCFIANLKKESRCFYFRFLCSVIQAKAGSRFSGFGSSVKFLRLFVFGFPLVRE